MNVYEKNYFYDEDTDQLLGILAKDATSWLAQTVFGYTLARTTSRQDAEKALRDHGKSSLGGVWHYLDPDEREWFPCAIQEAGEKKVIVIRTSESGMRTPETYKHVILMNPSEENLIKIQ